MNFSLSPAGPLNATALQQALQTDRHRWLSRLYRQAWPAVRRHVLRHHGTAHDAQDVFQDALVVFYEKAVAGQLTLTASPSTYLVAVSRHLWLRELNRRSRLPQSSLTDDHEDLPDGAELAETPLSILDYVQQLSEKCRNVLVAFYYFNEPLAQIAAQHDFGSIRSATVQKFKCLERLRNAVRNALATAFQE